MTENFATSLIVAEDATGPAGAVAGPFSIRGTNVLLSRRPITAIQRRDAWRSVTHQLPVISSHQLGWEFEISGSDATEIVFDALADPGSSTLVGGLRSWQLGQPSDVRRFDFVLDPVEGGHFELRGAACTEAQLVMDRGRLATWTTQWVGRQLTTDDSEPTATDASGANFGGAIDVQIAFADIEAVIMSGAVAFTRDLAPAQYGTDNVAKQWTGRHSVDVVGRLICRIPNADYAELVVGRLIDTAATIQINCGQRERMIELPAIRLQATNRAFISQGTYEYSIDFVAVRTVNEPVASFTSEDL